MQVVRTVGWWGCFGVIVAISGCAGGDEDRESGLSANVTVSTPSGDAATAAESTGNAGSSSDAGTSTSPVTEGGSGSTTNDPSGTSDPGSTGGTSTGVIDETTSTGVPPSCGNGIMDPFEACDDGNKVDGDACLNSCAAAACGDGVLQAGVEACDDGNQVDSDGCRNSCVVAACGDGVVQGGVEACDDGNQVDNDGCRNSCVLAACGDGVVQAGVEVCDDGNKNDGDGCTAACLSECPNQGGGSLKAENGTGMGKNYCYEQGDSIDTRARKACESHFGVNACCVIPGGYAGLQWGQCGKDGGVGSLHFHPDPHPGPDHCAPIYVVGDVVSPGWCGAVLGNFLD